MYRYTTFPQFTVYRYGVPEPWKGTQEADTILSQVQRGYTY